MRRRGGTHAARGPRGAWTPTPRVAYDAGTYGAGVAAAGLAPTRRPLRKKPTATAR